MLDLRRLLEFCSKEETKMRLTHYKLLIISVFILLNYTAVSGQSTTDESSNIDFSKIKNQEIVKTFETARAYNKPVLLIFDATWCPYCKKFNEETLRDEKVVETLSNFEKLNIDVDQNAADAGFFDGKPASLGGSGIPAIIIFTPEGKELARTKGAVEPKYFISFLEKQLKKQKEAEAAVNLLSQRATGDGLHTALITQK